MVSVQILMVMASGMRRPYHDADPNDGGFNPKEFEDRNGNGQYDPGLTQVFKQGSVIADFDYHNMKMMHQDTGSLIKRFITQR